MWPSSLKILWRKVWLAWRTRGGNSLPWHDLGIFLSRRLQVDAENILAFEPLTISSVHGRYYFILIIRDVDREQRYFVKCHEHGRFARHVYRVPAVPDWPVPNRFWQGVWQGCEVAVDSFVVSRSLTSFPRASDDELIGMVLAMARVNIASANCVRRRLISSPLLHVQPIAHVLKERALGDSDLVQSFTDWEPRLLAWLRALPIETLNHQDCRPSNVLVGDEQIWLVDWDSARPGPFGLSLWHLTVLPLPRRRAVIAVYADALRQAGYPVSDNELLHRMAVQYLFWCLVRGVALDEMRRIECGLALFRDEIIGSFT